MNKDFIIPINRLKTGSNAFEWHVDGAFFGTFENSEILDADLSVSVEIINEDYDISVIGKIEGSVTVTCDRCMESLVLPIDTRFEDDEFEDCDEIDLNQDIYDFACLTLPMQRTHPEGECNEDTVKYLSK